MSNQEQKLAGKIAVITGGNSGIGLATAKRLIVSDQAVANTSKCRSAKNSSAA